MDNQSEVERRGIESQWRTSIDCNSLFSVRRVVFFCASLNVFVSRSCLRSFQNLFFLSLSYQRTDALVRPR